MLSERLIDKEQAYGGPANTNKLAEIAREVGADVGVDVLR